MTDWLIRGATVAVLGGAYLVVGGWATLALVAFFAGVFVLGSYIAARSEDDELNPRKYRTQLEQNGVKK